MSLSHGDSNLIGLTWFHRETAQRSDEGRRTCASVVLDELWDGGLGRDGWLDEGEAEVLDRELRARAQRRSCGWPESSVVPCFARAAGGGGTGDKDLSYSEMLAFVRSRAADLDRVCQAWVTCGSSTVV